MKKVCLYARYSSDSQTEQSIEGQIRVCKDFASKNDFVIVKEYIDRAMTGTNDKRPAFQQMLLDSKKHDWEFVLVYKFDRFARSRHDSAVNKAILKKNGVKVISATELISDSPEGIILEGMLESFAEYYSAELSQKVKRGLKESRIKGLFTGGSIPYGYKVINQKPMIEESQSKIIIEMFEDYLSGMRLKDIVDKLVKAGIKNANGKNFTINSVSRILRNENYKGVVFADDTTYINIYPALVKEALFDEVNNRLKVSKRTSAHHKGKVNYLLSGKLFCGKCNGLMTGDSGKGKLGKVYNYYKCFSKKKDNASCDKKSMSKEYFEDKIITASQEFLSRVDLPKLANKIVNVYNNNIKENYKLKTLEKEVSENKKKLQNILSALENGIFNDTTNQRMQELEITIKEIEEKIAVANTQTTIPFDEKTILEYLQSFKDLDYTKEKAKQRLIDMFINRIVLFDDYADIYFNSSEDNNTKVDLKKTTRTRGFGLF